ncbi:hypothetical protein ACFFU9_00615 [Mariniflexile ostreae]|uniref:Protein involved in gliding motility SprE n=1 Tax=Mariniflexile ostreae TaxID=1520892 RepID=A0ABV5F710_9FLAO
MKTFYYAISAIAISACIITGCSRKKDKFLSRNYHALTTEYNALYNGYIALEQGRQNLNNAYSDNYWDILPIERMEINEEIILPGQSKNEDFNRSEEKAVKAIQKHSMNIDGKEKNPQMDEAYLLLGKARYFDQRFIPALEAFNYILYKYPASDKINQAKIWREKTNIRLENDELAIENLKRLLKQEDITGQDLADATSILAQAYINTKVLDTAITLLETASYATKNNEERGRYRFIQGQLYNKLSYKDSANMAFDRVIALNRKTPRIYMINAHLEKVKNFDYEKGDTIALWEFLTELEEDRENRPFLDKIYHQIGQFHLEREADSLAIAYYNKSLRVPSQDKQLKAKNYQILGDMNFDSSVYKLAGAYYDSTLLNLKLNSKPYRTIKRKRDNLEDVIYYEQIAQVNDSVLKLVNFSEEDKLAYFENFVAILKKQAEDEKAKQEAAERNRDAGLEIGGVNLGNSSQISAATRGPGAPSQAALFYFYNPTTVAYGKNEFVKTWGNRRLEDNWRWSNKNTSELSNPDVLNSAVAERETVNEYFDPQFYISKIPSTEKEIDSISKERNYAYYQLGLIYKEKFKEYNRSKNKFEALLKSNPEDRLVLPSKYNLYKIYELLGENSEAEIAKKDIIKNYPDSRYATILTNPDFVSEKDENSPESIYETVYAQYENQEYAQVIRESETHIRVFDGDPIVPKFELLKATAIGRLYGYEPYSEAINQVAVTYANVPEGQQAQHIVNQVLTRIKSTELVEDEAVEAHYKVIFQFEKATQSVIQDFNTVLNEVLLNIKYYDLKTSIDVYNPDTVFVVIHGLKNKTVAKTFDQLLIKEDKKKIKKPYFAISSKNYQTIQIHKNLETYLGTTNN